MRVNSVQSVPAFGNAAVLKKVSKFTNEEAVALLRKELKSGMDEKSIDSYIEMVQKVCNKLKLQIKDLPINKDHKGNLTPLQNHNFSQEIFSLSLFG